jgi:hypothetical protein
MGMLRHEWVALQEKARAVTAEVKEEDFKEDHPEAEEQVAS